ncbi:MAG: FtsX-like permease family protein [Bacteroidota bacterium]
MKLGFVAYKNMISKPLNMVLSLLLLVLSVSLVTFVLQLSKQLNGQMDKNINPVDMVVGAKGSPLQLVLSSVLHIDTPTGNVKLEEAEQIMNHPFVGSAIPVSYGDNYKGYRILGTEPEYLERYEAVLQEGRLFDTSFEIVAGNAVAQKLRLKIGDKIISSHGLAAAGGEAHEDNPYTIVGILEPSGTVVDQLLICNLESIWDAHDHGDEGHDEEEHHHDDDHDDEGHQHSEEEHDHAKEEEHHHDDEHDHDHDDEGHHEGAHDHDDEGHQHGEEEHDHAKEEEHHHDDEHDHDHGDEGHHEEAHDHDDEGHQHSEDEHDHAKEEEHQHDDAEHGHEEEKEITSLLVKFKNPIGLVQLPRFINENTNMQAALPGFEIQRLLGLLGSGVKTLNGIAIAILLVSGFSIFISLLKTIRERRQELALLRTYGLGTRKLLFLVLFEGLFLAFIGFLLGWLLGRLALILASKYIESGYGYVLQINGPDFVELLLLGVTLLIAIIAVFLASTSIFKLNISKILGDA